MFPGSKVHDPFKQEQWLTEPENLRSGAKLIDLWSHTCHGCIKELKQLKKLRENYKTEIIGVHTPELPIENRETAKKAVKRHRIDYPVVHDEAAALKNKFGDPAVKQVLLKEGEVKNVRRGHEPFKQLEEKLAEALEQENQETVSETPQLKHVYFGHENPTPVNRNKVFQGRKRLKPPQHRLPEEPYLEGEWIQREDHLEAGENARLYIKFEGPEFGIVAEPEGEKKAAVIEDGEKRDDKLKFSRPGLHTLNTSEQVSELLLQPEKGLKIYGISHSQS